MNSGAARHRVTIKSPTETAAGDGGVATTWVTTVATVWAEIVPVSGREFLAAQQVKAERQVRIRIRYRGDVTPRMRVYDGSTAYEINAVLNVAGRSAMLDLMCTEAA